MNAEYRASLLDDRELHKLHNSSVNARNASDKSLESIEYMVPSWHELEFYKDEDEDKYYDQWFDNDDAYKFKLRQFILKMIENMKRFNLRLNYLEKFTENRMGTPREPLPPDPPPDGGPSLLRRKGKQGVLTNSTNKS